MEYSPKKIHELLEYHGFNFKKMFGQNFIVDENIIDSIIRKAKIESDTLVIEIGPGAGSLTNKLAKVAKQVLCYEIDHTLDCVLNTVLSDFHNIDIIYQDFLKSDILHDIQKYDYQHLYVVANLPYYITTPIIMKLIEKQIPVDKIVVMVQKEVGDRFKAKPGTKDYGSLSIFLQYYFEIEKLLDVSKHVFLPKPNVDSIVVSLTRRKNLYPVENIQLFFQLIKDSFVQKRKTLRNNLKNYDLDKIEKVLNQYHYDLSVRAEALSIDIFVEIANELSHIT